MSFGYSEIIHKSSRLTPQATIIEPDEPFVLERLGCFLFSFGLRFPFFHWDWDLILLCIL